MPKVLIVEDDLMIADMTEDTLLKHGYAVCGIGCTVAEAVRLGHLHRPDFAIVDIRLADGGLGTEVVSQFAGPGRFGVLYASGNIMHAALTAVDGEACLAKPYGAADLLRGLESVAEMIAFGTATRPFPRGFHLLSQGPQDRRGQQ